MNKEYQPLSNNAELFRARFNRKPRVILICASAIADDPRVRRQGDLFYESGWDVIAVGLPGARSPASNWPILTTEVISKTES